MSKTLASNLDNLLSLTTEIGTLDNFEVVIVGGENAGDVEIISTDQINKSDTTADFTKGLTL